MGVSFSDIRGSLVFCDCLFLYLTQLTRSVEVRQVSHVVIAMGIASSINFDPRQAVLLLLFGSLFLYGLYLILVTGRRKSGMPPGRD